MAYKNRALLFFGAVSFLLSMSVPLAAGDSVVREDGYLYLATFNVFKLGAVDSRYKSLSTIDTSVPARSARLAEVISVGAFDLVVLQEVYRGERGHAAMTDLVRALEENHGLEYEYLLSDHIGQGLIPEAIAFLYRPNFIEPESLDSLGSRTLNIDIPGRDLVISQWEAGSFDFTLISAHLAWGNHEQRRIGYEAISEIFANPDEWSEDPDIIVLGDFNRFGDRTDAVLGLEYDPAIFRIPNVSIFDPDINHQKQVTKTAIAGRGIPGNDPQLLSTTVAPNTFVYDMVMIAGDSSEEFPAPLGEARYGTDFGIIHFDEPSGFGYQEGADQMDQNELKQTYSDHRPLWLRFRTDMVSHADD